jgi:hypothetical protein
MIARISHELSEVFGLFHDSLLPMKECPRKGELYRVRFHEQAAYQGNSQITRHDSELGIILERYVPRLQREGGVAASSSYRCR